MSPEKARPENTRPENTRDDLRRWAKAHRRGLPLDEISQAIGFHLRHWAEWSSLDWVLGFYPKTSATGLIQEVDLRAVMGQGEGPRWYLPKVQERGMAFYPYPGEDAMVAGSFGILEPPGEGATVWRLDRGGRGVVLVPALCVDGVGGRLGYGQGYYDRFLTAWGLKGQVPLLAVVPEDLRVPAVPQEGHDVGMDGVVTEAGVTWF